jgi:hypothetical protein
MKCKKKVEAIETVENLSKKGMKYLRGKCQVCGTTVCKMIGK